MTSGALIALVGFIYFAVAIDLGLLQHKFWHAIIWLGYAIAQAGLWRITIMSKYDIMTPEIEEIDKTIVLLKSKRTKLVAEAAKRKADALCAEMRKRKSK